MKEKMTLQEQCEKCEYNVKTPLGNYCKINYKSVKPTEPECPLKKILRGAD